MNVHLIHNIEKEQDWVTLKGDFEQYHVYGDNEDYVEDTLILMKKAVKGCFHYPFYIHFEAYDEDDVQSILLMCNRLDIYHQKSGRKVLTMSGGKTYHAEVPSFTVKISSEQELEYVSEQWFHFAQENNMWLLTQCSSLQYKDGFAIIDIENEPIILLVDHDAQGILFITGSVYYQNKDRILSLFQ